jgi:excisionase family DNA binding protein
MKSLNETKTVGDLIDLINPGDGRNEPRKQWLAPRQISKELGLHVGTVYHIIQTEELPVYNITVGRTKTYYRIKRSDMDLWLEGRRRRPVVRSEKVD